MLSGSNLLCILSAHKASMIAVAPVSSAVWRPHEASFTLCERTLHWYTVRSSSIAFLESHYRVSNAKLPRNMLSALIADSSSLCKDVALRALDQ
jgi:hypothetical protein